MTHFRRAAESWRQGGPGNVEAGPGVGGRCWGFGRRRRTCGGSWDPGRGFLPLAGLWGSGAGLPRPLETLLAAFWVEFCSWLWLVPAFSCSSRLVSLAAPASAALTALGVATGAAAWTAGRFGPRSPWERGPSRRICGVAVVPEHPQPARAWQRHERGISTGEGGEGGVGARGGSHAGEARGRAGRERQFGERGLGVRTLYSARSPKPGEVGRRRGRSPGTPDAGLGPGSPGDEDTLILRVGSRGSGCRKACPFPCQPAEFITARLS